MAVEPSAAEPQAESVPVDHQRGLVGDERLPENHPNEVSVRQRAPNQIQARMQDEAVRLLVVDGDPQPRSLVADPDGVARRPLP